MCWNMIRYFRNNFHVELFSEITRTKIWTYYRTFSSLLSCSRAMIECMTLSIAKTLTPLQNVYSNFSNFSVFECYETCVLNTGEFFIVCNSISLARTECRRRHTTSYFFPSDWLTGCVVMLRKENRCELFFLRDWQSNDWIFQYLPTLKSFYRVNSKFAVDVIGYMPSGVKNERKNTPAAQR